ncbi:sugar ABC transporter substrate-binding protein [Halomonas sp. DP8Y7-1]|uniref:ABC transporter substrate-binding protein n=1 Tax=Halomonas sp. DP8Y7-1 TaxID=2859078 RepID=UPI001C9673B5|nr:sugar ABC transporter substrate-binding protein [Halomonas sp. DP8Y7-1]MBY6027902.1 sugar ABC transporter substrate-binding protein [Halomonas sp. DP8Y7-1]
MLLRTVLVTGSLTCVLSTGPALAESSPVSALTIATVGNRDMVRMQQLSEGFTAANPDIELQWVALDENTLRQHVTTDIATAGGRFDIVTIGTYEAAIWAERGWLLPLDDLPASYQVDDLLPTVREALSFQGQLYAAPFYAESAFTLYREDLFAEAGLSMVESPSWEFIARAAAALHDPDEHYGICLRGKPGWGENMALLTAMANAYGGRWFDMQWVPQLATAAWRDALDQYLSLLWEYGPPNPEQLGFNDNLALFQQGKCAIWVDATVAASAVTNPRESMVADRVGFALAPQQGMGKRANWLWAWALAIPSSSTSSDAAKRFIAWATSADFQRQVADDEGWAQVPPGTRRSLYANPHYQAAAPYSDMVLESLTAADPGNPTVEPVPYRGIQYVAIAAFPGIATAVGNRFAKALAGEITVDEALENAQWVTQKVAEQARFADQ